MRLKNRIAPAQSKNKKKTAANGTSPTPKKKLSPVEKSNVRAICELDQLDLNGRSFGERLGDAIASNAGKPWFIVVHLVWFGLWVPFNMGIIRGLRPFDPYPFQFLTLIVSLEAIFLSLFILNSQSREYQRSERRAQLDLQINLLAELESTKTLQMLKALCEHEGLAIAGDAEIQQLVRRTNPEKLTNEIRRQQPENQ